MLGSGRVLQGRYVIDGRIGGGGMGTVYLADDNRLTGRRCAIKEMSPSELAPQDRNWSINAFRREAEILAQLSHPGLTAVTDFFAEHGNWYLVMDFVEGETLAARLASSPKGRFPIKEALRVVRQLLDVLDYLHNREPRVVFRDLKPGNVMITPEGQIKLIDFGIARFFKPGKTQDTTFLGTPGYAAPEQYGGMGQSDPRTDIYSLGVVLNQMVTGHDPTSATSPFPIPNPRSLMPSMPSHVAEVISRATQMRPELRYGSVEEMRQDLFPPTYPLPPGQTDEGRVSDRLFQPAPDSTPRRRGALIGLGIALALTLACGVGIFVAVANDWVEFPALVRADDDVDVPPGGPVEDPPDVIEAPQDVTVTPTEEIVEPSFGSGVTEEPTEEIVTSQPEVERVVEEKPTEMPTPTESVQPQLVYVRGNVGGTDIYVIDPKTGISICVACRPCDEAEPGWSPTGEYIVFQSDCEGSYDLWTVDRQGGSLRRLTRTPGVDEREPDWSPDGRRIVYRSSPTNVGRNEDGELRLIDSDGSNGTGLGIQGRSPVWSPDGTKLVFMSERDGSWEIYVYDFGTKQTRRMTNCTPNCRWPAWSPDGRMVIYHSTSALGSVTAETLWTLALDGGGPRQLITGLHPGRPSWSRDGLVAFNSDNGIELITAQGQDRLTLVRGEENWAPIWSK
ncbi:MAG: protein kinase domain-containing protein [Anaerolineae bacterium]